MKSIISSQAPPAVAPQFVMMQYCVDIRLDEMWREFLDFLIIKEDHLPPNPFPYLNAVLRKGNMRCASRNTFFLTRHFWRRLVVVVACRLKILMVDISF